MSFIPKYYPGESPTPWEYKPVKAITPSVGLLLTVDEATGWLEKAASGGALDYICMYQGDGEVEAGTVIPVIPVMCGVKYETQLDGATAFMEGAKIDVASDGLRADADANTNDDMTIVELGGSAEGDAVVVVFN